MAKLEEPAIGKQIGFCLLKGCKKNFIALLSILHSFRQVFNSCNLSQKKSNHSIIFSYGCAWSVYFDGCKYGKGGMNDINKFRMQTSAPTNVSQEIGTSINHLATLMGPLTQQLTPKCYDLMVKKEEQGQTCRIGNAPGKPFSGATIGEPINFFTKF